MKNIVVYTGLVLYVLLYITGTWVQIYKNDLVATVAFVSGPVFIAGLFFGRWAGRKDQEISEMIRQKCNF